MDQEFSMEKQDFTVIKDKIIKTNELLELYNEKNEKLCKATNAFKQIKSKYEAAMHETDRLKIDNERLNYNLEAIRTKYDQNEKELIELRSYNKKTEERYEQNMIESQLTISDFEEKIKHCTCERDLTLSPTKKGNSSDKVKELKRICMELKKVENNLKNENDCLQLKNKELMADKLNNSKVIQNFTAQNMSLQKDLIAVKNKVQRMELASKDQTNIQLTITSLKENHQKEISSLKMEISKLSLENQKIKYLELECKNLKQQISNTKVIKIKKSDCCVQTEGALETDKVSQSNHTNIQRINTLERKYDKLKKKFSSFKSNVVSKQDIGIQTTLVESIQTLKVWEGDSSDYDDSISDILSEMILPKALSPLSFSMRSLESPTPSLLSMFEPSDKVVSQELFKEKSIPNIIITPPTPGVEKSSQSNVIFPLPTENLEKQSKLDKNTDEDRLIDVDAVFIEKAKEEMDKSKINDPDSGEVIEISHEPPVITVEEIHEDINCKTLSSASQSWESILNAGPTVEKLLLVNDPASIDNNEMLELKDSTAREIHISEVENKLSTKSIVSDTKEITTNENSLEKQVFCGEKGISSPSRNLVSQCENSVSTEEDLGPFKIDCDSSNENTKCIEVNPKKDFLKKNRLQNRRKFWIPYPPNSFVKLRKKCKLLKKDRITKTYKETSSSKSEPNDIILNALRTLQQNNINFTISNESIPLIQPYGCYSWLTPPKAEPVTTSRKLTNTFSYSLECWNKQCCKNNTKMLLRKVQHEEEPELLGFFSIKDEVITPSASRMAVLEQPKPFDADNLVTQLLSGIKDLVDVQRKVYPGNRRKKRPKSKNRRSDFYSETETELEKLFRESADVLGRNRRFLAAAKEQSFKSSEDSMFECESDAMVDSGVFSGTPNIDTNSLSFLNHNKLDKDEVLDIANSVNRNDLNTPQDHTLQVLDKYTPASVKNNENILQLCSTPSLLCNDTTPKFSTCPTMLSPIASSKGSPETLQVSSDYFTVPEGNTNSQISPNSFKMPFCPIMISPLASSKGSPVSQTSMAAKMKDVRDDDLDDFKMPLCSIMVSPLASSAKNYSGNSSENFTITDDSSSFDKSVPVKENDLPVKIFQTQRSDISDSPKATNIDTCGLPKNENIDSTKDNDIKPLYSKNRKSSICQRITFDPIVNNEEGDECLNLLNMNPKNPQKELTSSLNGLYTSQFLETTDVSQEDNVLSVDNIILENKKEHLVKAVTDIYSEESKTIETKKNKLDSTQTVDNILHIDLSIKSCDLDYTLDDINISQLDISSAKHNDSIELNEEPKNDIYLRKRSHSNSKETCKSIESKHPKETGTVERRYSLRSKSQSESKKENNFKLEPHKNVSLETENIVNFTSPRTRAAKRKMEELKNKEKEYSNDTNVFSAQESDEVAGPVTRKKGRPQKVVKITGSKGIKESESLVKSSIEMSGQKDDKFEKNHKEESRNAAEVTDKILFGSDSEENNISPKKENILLSHSVTTDESPKGEGQPKMVKKLLKNRRRSSNLNKDNSMELIDWELHGSNGPESRKANENFTEIDQNLVRERNNDITSDAVVGTEGSTSGNGMKVTLSKNIEANEKSRRFLSKEFVSESESECDIALKDQVETKNCQTGLVEQVETKNCQTGLEELQSNNDNVNCQGSALKNTNLLTPKNNAPWKSKNEEENKETTTESNNDLKNSVQTNSNNQITTSVIQNILRSISEDTSQTTRNTSYLERERDLFGYVSDSEEEDSCNSKKKLKVSHKTIVKNKVAPKQNLKKKMLNQVKGTVYAYGKNKVCDIIRNSCENKRIEPFSRSVSEDSSLSDVSTCKKEEKKIYIVQNILISKGQAISLLSNHDEFKQFSSTLSNSKASEHINPVTKASSGESLGTYLRKKIKLEQNISSFSTPVDILSQVMQGMVKSGPKTAKKNVSSQSNYLSSNQYMQPQKNVSSQSNYLSSNQYMQPQVNHVGGFTTGQEKIKNDTVEKQERLEKNVLEDKPVGVIKNMDELLDCPKSPDLLEMPDRLPKLIPTEKPEKLQPSKARTLIDKLMVFSNETKMLDDVIREFAFQDMTFMVEIIIDKLSKDYHDKADNSFPPSPPMASTQRILLGFLLKLDRSTHPGIRDKFLSLAEMQLFNRSTCKLEIVQPITRLYTALCKLGYDMNGIRRFICDGFYYMGDFAVPMFFTVLTMWPDVLPMESESSDNLLAKVIVQLCLSKECNQPGYNLLPLKDLLKKYYGYPSERWNCEDIFMEIMVEYIRNPSIRLSDFTLLLYLKNKPTKWVHQKLKEVIIPLYHQASDKNPNLKATLIILLANICYAFQKYEDYDWSVILEMDRWFIELDTDDLDPIIKRSIHLARGRLPRRIRLRNRNKNKNTNDESNKLDNKDNLNTSQSNCEGTRSCAEGLSLDGSKQKNCEDTNKTNVETTTENLKKEYMESTNDIVNIDSKLGHSSQTKCEYKIENFDTNLAESESDSNSSSDIEF